MFIYIYMYIYVYIYVYSYIYIYIYICIYIYIQIYIYMYAYKHIYLYILMCVYIYLYIHSIYIHIHMHIHIHTYKYTHTLRNCNLPRNSQKSYLSWLCISNWRAIWLSRISTLSRSWQPTGLSCGGFRCTWCGRLLLGANFITIKCGWSQRPARLFSKCATRFCIMPGRRGWKQGTLLCSSARWLCIHTYKIYSCASRDIWLCLVCIYVYWFISVCKHVDYLYTYLFTYRCIWLGLVCVYACINMRRVSCICTHISVYVEARVNSNAKKTSIICTHISRWVSASSRFGLVWKHVHIYVESLFNLYM